MLSVEMKPAVWEEGIRTVVRRIAGVEPNITILQASRVAFTIDVELTDEQKRDLAEALSELRHFNWDISLTESNT